MGGMKVAVGLHLTGVDYGGVRKEERKEGRRDIADLSVGKIP